jgi:hypothetical protein
MGIDPLPSSFNTRRTDTHTQYSTAVPDPPFANSGLDVARAVLIHFEKADLLPTFGPWWLDLWIELCLRPRWCRI